MEDILRKTAKCSSRYLSRQDALFQIMAKFNLQKKPDVDCIYGSNDFQHIDIDAQNSCGWTALMKSSIRSFDIKYEKMAKVLIENGADLNIQNNGGDTALIESSGFVGIRSSEDMVEMLIGAGADMDIQNGNGNTALIKAVKMVKTTNSIETIKLLIEAGADLNIRDNLGYTALTHIFCGSYNGSEIYGNEEAVGILIEAGSDVNVVDNRGQNILTKILLKQCQIPMKVIKILIVSQELSGMIDLNSRSRYKSRTILMLAVRSLYPAKIVKLLIEKGADLNSQDEDGNTALMTTSCVGRLMLEKHSYLIESGCDLNIRNNEGNTALMSLLKLRLDKYKRELVLKMIEYGVDLSIRNNDGETAFEIARKFQSKEDFKIFR